MNAQKFTQKSLEAIQSAQELAIERQTLSLDEEHLLLALLNQDQGLIPQLLTSMQVDADAFRNDTQKLCDQLPAVSGPGREAGKIYVSQELDRMLTASERIADSMKDEYVSCLLYTSRCV